MLQKFLSEEVEMLFHSFFQIRMIVLFQLIVALLGGSTDNLLFYDF